MLNFRCNGTLIGNYPALLNEWMNPFHLQGDDLILQTRYHRHITHFHPSMMYFALLWNRLCQTRILVTIWTAPNTSLHEIGVSRLNRVGGTYTHSYGNVSWDTVFLVMCLRGMKHGVKYLCGNCRGHMYGHLTYWHNHQVKQTWRVLIHAQWSSLLVSSLLKKEKKFLAKSSLVLKWSV